MISRKNSKVGKNPIRFRYKEKGLSWIKIKLRNMLVCLEIVKDKILKCQKKIHNFPLISLDQSQLVNC